MLIVVAWTLKATPLFSLWGQASFSENTSLRVARPHCAIPSYHGIRPCTYCGFSELCKFPGYNRLPSWVKAGVAKHRGTSGAACTHAELCRCLSRRVTRARAAAAIAVLARRLLHPRSRPIRPRWTPGGKLPPTHSASHLTQP